MRMNSSALRCGRAVSKRSLQLSTSGNEVPGVSINGSYSTPLQVLDQSIQQKLQCTSNSLHLQNPHLHVKIACPGSDTADATSAQQPVPDFAEGLLPVHQLSSRPLEGKRIGVLQQTMGPGIDPGVHDATQGALKHLESLGATVSEVMTSDVPLLSLAWLWPEVTYVLGYQLH